MFLCCYGGAYMHVCMIFLLIVWDIIEWSLYVMLSEKFKLLVATTNCCLSLLGEIPSSLITWVWHAAAVIVAKKETWRRREIWKRVQDFHALTGIPITSPIISLIVGSEEKALQSSRFISLSLSPLFVCMWLLSLLRQLLNMPIILEQAFVEIWFPCNCNQTPNSASQLMQVCCVLFVMLLFFLFYFSIFFWVVSTYVSVALVVCILLASYQEPCCLVVFFGIKNFVCPWLNMIVDSLFASLFLSHLNTIWPE